MNGEIFFNTIDGIRLEGNIRITEPGKKSPCGIICHPHPQYGGDMDNNVVISVEKALISMGFVSLRFNFRGAGGSEGYSTGGDKEHLDVQAALDFITNHEKVDNKNIYIIGYSFGSMVGIPVAVEDNRVYGWIAVSPPTIHRDFGFAVKCKKNKLLIVGDNDFVCPLTDFEEFFLKLSQPKSKIIIKGSDHFHFGMEGEIEKGIKTFLKPMGKNYSD
ncbi:MAG: CocE/NonD family hydrolase [Thermodesulfobacteriota bacterium]|nr:CocE/NonD family hydrolase [Thermodesulfobacteriota bacterium]